MYKLPFNLTTRRNALLLAVAILLILARLTVTHLIDLRCWPDGFVWPGLIVVGGAFAGLIFRKLGCAILPSTESPWYVRRGAFLFLVVMLVLINILYADLTSDVLAPLFHLNEPDEPHWFFLMLAVELLGIVLVDWPQAQSANKHEPGNIRGARNISGKL